MAYSRVWIEERYTVRCNDTSWEFDNRGEAEAKALELGEGTRPTKRSRTVKSPPKPPTHTGIGKKGRA